MEEGDRDSIGSSAAQRDRLAHFAPFVFDPSGGLLSKGGAEVVLPPRAARLLACLLRHPGRLVAKDALIADVWNDVAVSDQSLAEAISQLRHALDDDPAVPTYVQTVHRRGYRFIAPVAWSSRESPAHDAATVAAPPAVTPGTISSGTRMLPLLRRARPLVGFAALAVLVAAGALFIRPLEQQQRQLAEIEDEMRRWGARWNSLLGSNLTAESIWTGASVSRGASPSPDGQLIAFGTDGPAPSLYRIDSGETIPLARDDESGFDRVATSPVFSPDNLRIAYRVQSYLGDVPPELRIVGVYDGEIDTIFRGRGAPIPHAWTPDGNYLVGTRWGDAGLEIVRVSVTGGDTTTLVTLGGRLADSPKRLSLSPDARTIAYDFPQQDGSGRRDIYLLSLAGGSRAPELVVQDPANDLLPMWTPDGRGLLFISNRSGDYAAWVVYVADDNRRVEGPQDLLRLGAGSMIWPLGLTRDGSLYYAAGSGPSVGSDVYVADLEPGTLQGVGTPWQIVPSFPGLNLGPTWSHDGNRLAYLSQRGLFLEPDTVITITEPSGARPEKKTPGLRYFRNPRWSPDGRSILIRGADAQSSWGLYLIDLLTMEATPVVQPGEADSTIVLPGARFSPDGRGIVYGRNHEEEATDPLTGGTQEIRTQVLVLRPLGGGAERELHRVVGPAALESWTLSPDGGYLAISVSQPEGEGYTVALTLISLGIGRPKEILRVWSPLSSPLTIDGLEWCSGSDRILFTKDGDGDVSKERDLWAVSTRTGEEERIGISAPGLRNVACDPTGTRIAFVANTQAPSTDVLAVRNFVLGGTPTADEEGRSPDRSPGR